MLLIIYLVRHGETDLNKKRILQGRYDSSLNEDGIRLAKISGKALKDVHFFEAFSSPLIRSKQTIDLILNESGNVNTKITVDDRLCEVDVGKWTLTPLNDKTNVFVKDIDSFFKDPFSFLDVPMGENVHDVIKRTASFIEELIKRNDDNIYLIGSHGFAIRALLNYFYEDKKDFWHGRVPYNCSFTIIEIKDGNFKFLANDICYYDDNKKDYYSV